MKPTHLAFACGALILLMLPIWPVSGIWFGLPAWVVLAVGTSAVASLGIAWAALYRWPGDAGRTRDGD